MLMYYSTRRHPSAWNPFVRGGLIQFEKLSEIDKEDLEDYIKWEEFETPPGIDIYVEKLALPIWHEMEEVYIDVMVYDLEEGKQGYFYEPNWLYGK